MGLLQLFDFDVFPGGGEGPLFFADTVNLKADVTFGVGLENLFVREV